MSILRYENMKYSDLLGKTHIFCKIYIKLREYFLNHSQTVKHKAKAQVLPKRPTNNLLLYSKFPRPLPREWPGKDYPSVIFSRPAPRGCPRLQ